jgi:hypothetical protein
MDLAFGDGSHARPYVGSDSSKALRMARPGGLVRWHDYDPDAPDEIRGVRDELTALASRPRLRHIEGTTLVVYQDPPA